MIATGTKKLRRALFMVPWSVLIVAGLVAGQEGSAFRGDRISLQGEWKFQLRHDNQLTGKGPVSFGPVSASSQALLIAPQRGEAEEGSWRTSVPWPVSATLVDCESQFWKPHPAQQGATWWRADLGSPQKLKALRLNWVKPGQVSVVVETSKDGAQWEGWTRAESKPDEVATTVSGAEKEARFVRLQFSPAQFEGTGKIDVYLADPSGAVSLWRPRVRKEWYEELRKFTPQDGFHTPAFDDAGWSSIRVPGSWEAQGFSKPTWYQPDDTVGYYRRKFAAPERWRGRVVRLRFEGVNNSAQVWLNGQEVGYHESGFTPFESEVTPFLRLDKENVIAVRVAKWTLTEDYDTDDAWFLGGIWREAFLYSLPASRIDDFRLQTEFDSQYRDAVLRAEVKLRAEDAAAAHACIVEGSLFDAEGKVVPLEGFRAEATLAGRTALPVAVSSIVKNPHPWTAETPYLYSLLLRLKVDGQVVQEIKQAVGFRQVEVKGNQLLLNGVPLQIRGVVTTRSNPNDAGESSEQVFAREIRLLKEGNINAIRSHTTALEDEFLDLCDRYGIYVIPDIPNVWVAEYDFRYLTEGTVQRARDNFEKHKNRTCVIAWHIGNENGDSTASFGMGRAARWLAENDPTRPVAICGNPADRSEFGTSLSDQHYNPMQQEQFKNPQSAPLMFGEFHAIPNYIATLKDRGFAETWGRSFQQEWAEFEKRPWVVGGLICCWDDGSVNGNLGENQWGVVDSKRQPKPVHYHIRKVFSPVQLTLENPSLTGGRLTATLAVTNKFRFTNLEGFRFRWELVKAGKVVASGEETYRVEPGKTASFPLALNAPGGSEHLRLSVFDGAGYFIQNEEFRLPVSSRSATMSEVLKKVGVARTAPLSLSPGASEIRASGYRAQWGSDGQVRLQGRDGQDLLTLGGIMMQQPSGARPPFNVPLGPAQYGPASADRRAVSLPFSIEGKSADGKARKVTGTIRLEFGAAWLQVSYEFQSPDETVIRESGVRLRLAETLSQLSWNRAALWRSAHEGWADSSLEEGIALKALEESMSRRDLYWAIFQGEGKGILMAPLASSIHLRAGENPREVVLSDFLSASDFLGKFDSDTIQKKLPPGEKFHGGFVLYFLSRGQVKKLRDLPAPAKDLTWARVH